jgi:hypothetical protein
MKKIVAKTLRQLFPDKSEEEIRENTGNDVFIKLIEPVIEVNKLDLSEEDIENFRKSSYNKNNIK